MPWMCLGAEQQGGKDVAAAAHADDGDLGRRLHQIGGIDDVVLEVAELAHVAVVPGDDGGRIRVDIEAVLFDPGLWRARVTPAKRRGLAKRRHPDPRVGIPALEQRSGLLGPLGPEHAEMAFSGYIKPGMHHGQGRQHHRNGAAQAQAASVAAASGDGPARAGGKGADSKRGAHRIDREQQEDDAETSKRRARKVGGVEPAAAIGQTRQQQRDADAAFGEGADEGDCYDRQRHQYVVAGDDERHAQEGDHGADARDREPRRVACELHSHSLGRVAGRLAVDLHRAARQSEHGKRDRGECEMIIQHDAEEAGDQYLVGQRGAGQHENCQIMAAENSGRCLQDTLLDGVTTDLLDAAVASDTERTSQQATSTLLSVMFA